MTNSMNAYTAHSAQPTLATAQTTMTWMFRNSPVVSMSGDAMVYVITLVPTGQHYIGKRFTRTKKLVQNRRVTVDRSFENYWSSSPVIARLRQQYTAPENWKRRILHWVQNRGLANYLEARCQMDLRVLESDVFLNGLIQVRTGSGHIRHLHSVETDTDLWAELINSGVKT